MDCCSVARFISSLQRLALQRRYLTGHVLQLGSDSQFPAASQRRGEQGRCSARPPDVAARLLLKRKLLLLPVPRTARAAANSRVQCGLLGKE